MTRAHLLRAAWVAATVVTLSACQSGGEDPAAPTVQQAGAGSGADSDESTGSATTEDLPPISDAELRFGLALPGGPTSEEMVELAVALDESPGIVVFFKDFNQPVPLHELDVIAARGAEAVIAWEPWTWDAGVEQPEYRLSEITAGRYDEYLDEWGRDLATWGKPVTLRFAHEMNGNWYPWAESVNGNQPGDYVEAYRHVFDRVTQAGADNVRWMWSPNSLADPNGDLSGFYPGEDYVDVVGVDGYNWGNTRSWSVWQTPEEIFGPTLEHVREIAPGKELLIAETASVPVGGDQGEWVSSLVSFLTEPGDITGFVWFHEEQDVDWRLQDDSLDNLREALKGRE